MSINIDELKKDLKHNPVFNMSLSGKEIFHSNVLAWLLSETNDNDEATSTAKALTKLFPPKGLKADEKAEEKYRVLTVFREKNDFDLLVLYLEEDDYKKFKEARENAAYDSKINIEDASDEIKFDNAKKDVLKPQMDCLAKCKFVVIENKFKAIPDCEQLDRYYFEICGYKKNTKNEWHNNKNINLVNIANVKFEKNGKIQINEDNTTCFLLAPQEALNLFRNNSKKYTNKKIFDYKYKEKDKTQTKKNETLTVEWSFVSYDDLIEEIKPEGQNKEILERYLAFTKQMLELSKEAINVESSTKVYDFEGKVKLLKSIRIHDFYARLWFSAVMSIIRNDLLREVKEGLITDVGYSNGMGMLNFMYDFEQYSEARFGIEIQAKQFRIAVYITNKKQYKWETEEGTTDKDLEKNQYPKIFYWLKSIYKQIKQDNKEHFDYPDEKELELKKFADFKYIKIPIKEQNLTIEVLGKKIKEVLSIMKSNEKNFEGKTESLDRTNINPQSNEKNFEGKPERT